MSKRSHTDFLDTNVRVHKSKRIKIEDLCNETVESGKSNESTTSLKEPKRKEQEKQERVKPVKSNESISLKEPPKIKEQEKQETVKPVKSNESTSLKESPKIKEQEKQDNKKENFGLSDTLTVEHAVSVLQTAIKDLIEKAPNETTYKNIQDNSSSIESSEVLLALKRSKLTLASKLKTLYEEGKLTIFDQILNFEEIKETNFEDIKLVLDDDSIKKTERLEDTKDKNYLPPIPPIKNPSIRAQVFLHKSLIKDKIFLSKSEMLHAHNERLEFIGDSVLNNIMTLIVYNKYPNASEGELSQLRTRLISNAVLQKWSFQYGLEKRLKQNIDDTVSRGRMKIYSDVFEAYIGGLITESSDNYPIVYNWLKQLAEILLTENSDEVIIRINRNHKDGAELKSNAKVELYSLIGHASLGLSYKTIDKRQDRDMTTFIVQVQTKDGDILGTGTGKNTKEAGLRAAMNALSDKPMIEKYSKLRASIPRDTSSKPVGFDPEKDDDYHKPTDPRKQKENKDNKDNRDTTDTPSIPTNNKDTNDKPNGSSYQRDNKNNNDRPKGPRRFSNLSRLSKLGGGRQSFSPRVGSRDGNRYNGRTKKYTSDSF